RTDRVFLCRSRAPGDPQARAVPPDPLPRTTASVAADGYCATARQYPGCTTGHAERREQAGGLGRGEQDRLAPVDGGRRDEHFQHHPTTSQPLPATGLRDDRRPRAVLPVVLSLHVATRAPAQPKTGRAPRASGQPVAGAGWRGSTTTACTRQYPRDQPHAQQPERGGAAVAGQRVAAPGSPATLATGAG